MRRRNQLRVNTFPFLAVLLCAMGALILLLLVMDRRARVAAAQRGQEDDRRADALLARDRDGAGPRGEVKAAYDRKKADLKARLDAEQRALDGEMRQVQTRLAEIAGELRGEEELVGSLRTNVRREQVRLTRHEQALEAARKEAADLGGKLSAGDRARQKLAADMVRLEQVIRDLQEARKRDALTYSVEPANGKGLDKRSPLFVECGASGLVFHPDKFTLTEPTLPAIREEVARRAARFADQRKQAGLKEERAYLLMLIRPNGIKRYYQVQSAIHGLPVEFGTEFVDDEWTLTVPEGPELARAQTAPPEAVTAPNSVRLMGSADSPARVGPLGEPLPPVEISPPVVGSTGVDASVPQGRVQPPAEGPSLEIDPPVKGADLPPVGKSPPAEMPIVTAPLAALPGSIAAARQAVPPPAPGPAPIRVVAAASSTVFVECLSDGVAVHPSGKTFSIDALNHSAAHNPLYQEVLALLVRPGDARGRSLRFLVHRDAERTFDLAYPVFAPLGVAKSRRAVQPGEDVSRIVAGD